MALTPLVTICLPTRDLRAAARFYREGLGFPFSTRVADGELPEPVAFALNDDAVESAERTIGVRQLHLLHAT